MGRKLTALYLTILTAVPITTQAKQDVAIFAGGCFWCMEEPFDRLDGVISTTTGYTAGHKKNPTYEEVSEGKTGHTEAVKIIFDPDIISYSELLDTYWKNIDPVATGEQFCDFGSQYRTGIYYTNAEQQRIAEQSRLDLQSSKFSDIGITTEISAASPFYPAESYHQNYYQNNPVFYRIIRFTCGRDRRLDELWHTKTD